MSQIIEYFRSLFAPSSNNRGKRKRCEYNTEEPQYPIKYRRVSNIFPKTYSQPIDDEIDLFEEVKQRKPEYNELLESFLMDQNRKQSKTILEDGEFSDEDELTSYRLPSQRKPQKEPPFKFVNVNRGSQPSTSSVFFRSNDQRSHSSAFGDDNDIQFVSISRNPNNNHPQQQKSPRNDVPPLIPISSSVVGSSTSSSQMFNGHHSPDPSNRSVSAQPSRGHRSVLNFGSRFMAFQGNSPSPSPRNSVLNHNNNMEVKKQYDCLLKSLIPRYPTGMFNRFTKSKQPKEVKQIPVQTIDLSEDVEISHQRQSQASTYQKQNYSLGDVRKGVFKKPQAYIDLSDDEDQSTNFSQNQILSSTILKSTDKRRSLNMQFDQSRKGETSVLPDIKPINSLQEKQANLRACQPDVIDSIVRKFNESREYKDRAILEEIQKAEQLENERMKHERDNQKRIDESLLNAALSEKCIILDDEEELIDEFPPLKDEQLRVINFALHGARQEVIVSKFKMDVTRYDFATLDGLNWLNDMVINFYLELIKERSEQVEYLPKVHVMNTVFLGKLLEQGYQGVRRWTRRVDIFSYDVIPVPVHVGGVHWCMSIIHLKNKTIKYYDSMGHPNYMVLEALENYLKEESLDKRKTPFDMSDWTLECVRDCPQQKNGSDCGVFSCQFAEFVSRDSAISFEQQHMPYFRRKMIFEIATGKLMLGF